MGTDGGMYILSIFEEEYDVGVFGIIMMWGEHFAGEMNVFLF